MNRVYWLGLLALVLGFPLIVWSWRVYRQPRSLHPDSRPYRAFYVDSRRWPKTKKENSGKLTDREIRHYAMRGLIVGTVIVVMGIALIVTGILYPDFWSTAFYNHTP